MTLVLEPLIATFYVIEIQVSHIVYRIRLKYDDTFYNVCSFRKKSIHFGQSHHYIG
jgi:3-phenylpropionate/cinnamic acid dioxygenase small subunit